MKFSLSLSFRLCLSVYVSLSNSKPWLSEFFSLNNEVVTEVVWTCFPFIRSGQNHLARHMKGGRRQGRQRKRWEDNIREWAGLEFAKSQRVVENGEK